MSEHTVDSELEPETPEQVEERRASIRQEMADALGNLGYELDSDDETYEVLMWAFVDDPETHVSEEADNLSPETRSRVMEGLRQSAAGDIHDLGSFAEFADVDGDEDATSQ